MKKSCSVKLFKVGKFYNAYGDDGWIIHKLLGYKFVENKNGVGFPEIAIFRVKQELENAKIDYELYEKSQLIEKYKGISKNYKEILKVALRDAQIEKRIIELKNKLNGYNLEELERLLEIIENGNF